MNWKKMVNCEFFNAEISNKEEKLKIAKKIANKVKNGDVIGFGSGSTSFLAVKVIAKVMKEKNITIKAIPTSYEIKLLCEKLKIPTTSLVEAKPDWSFDGADEINKRGWLIKGRGGAMFKEKLNILNSKKVYILIDNSKIVKKLGQKYSVPVECFPESVNYVVQELISLGASKCELRSGKGKDGPVITENGNFIIDAKFENITSTLEKDIKSITGVLDSGLFIGYKNIEVIRA